MMRSSNALVLAVAAGMLGSPLSAAPQATIDAKTLDGVTFSLAGQRGHVAIVNFWATWCAPCRAELPALDAYLRAHRDSVVMLAVSLDAGASAKKLRAITAGYSFAVARIDDTRMPRPAIPTALPETRVYDRDGVLRFDSLRDGIAQMDAATLERVVTPLLGSQGATPR